MALISCANAFLCVDTQWTFRLVWWNRTHCRGFVRTCDMTREVADCRKAERAGKWKLKTIIKSFNFIFILLLIMYITFTHTALSDESHHQRSALVTLSGSIEGLYHKLVSFWL